MSTIPHVEEWYEGTMRIFPNGITAWASRKKEAKMYGTAITVRAGAAEDPADFPGCAHCFEHIPLRGAGRFPNKLSIFDPLEEYAGMLNAGTGSDHTRFYARTDHTTLDHTLDVLTAMVTDPLYNELNIEREAIAQEYRDLLASPPGRANVEKGSLFFRDPKWQHYAGMLPSNIHVVTVERLRSFHQEWYRPERMIVTIAGPSDEQKMLDVWEQRLGSIPSTNSIPVPPTSPYAPSVSKGVQTVTWDSTSVVMSCTTAFPATPQIYLLLDVLELLLDEGLSSPIFQELREKKGYFYSSGFGSGLLRGFGILDFVCQTSIEKADRFWEDFWTTAFSPSQLTERRLAWAKNNLLASARHRHYNPLVIAKGAANELLDFGQVFLRNDLLQRRMDVSLDQLRRFLEEYFSPGKCLQLTFRPE